MYGKALATEALQYNYSSYTHAYEDGTDRVFRNVGI
jgi:hypothetical protein